MTAAERRKGDTDMENTQKTNNRQAVAEMTPETRRAIEIIIELCYRFGRDRQAEKQS